VVPESSATARSPVHAGPDTDALEAEPFPDWFSAFLHDRQTRKPSAHTMKAYRQDFTAIASLVTNGNPAGMKVLDITKESMRAAFATYAHDHEAASIRRCWSTWNVLCTFLYTGEQLAANPMQLVGRPKLAKSLPKALPRTAVEALLETVAQDRDSKRQTDWAERDLAIILTALLAGLRAEELRGANIGDIRTTDDGAAVIHVKGKGGKERSVPIEAELLSVIQTYLDSRAVRFPAIEKRRATTGSGLMRWSARTPLFVGRDGERITQGTLQSRIKRAFKRAGPDAQPVPGALVHGLRHTYATELAGSDVSVYTLMKLLGHESMTTSQRYVTAAGTETRSAAAQNPLYALVPRRANDP
jgi:integrase/recombinase XerC